MRKSRHNDQRGSQPKTGFGESRNPSDVSKHVPIRQKIISFSTNIDCFSPQNCPPDYLVTTIGNLRTLLHYCLLDEAPQGQNVKQGPTNPNPTGAPFLSSLFHAFSSDNQVKDGSLKEVANPVMTNIRKALMSDLPRYLKALLSVWQAVTQAEKAEKPNHLLAVMGAPKLVKQQIIQCLQAISENYGEAFLAAVGSAWAEKSKKGLKHHVMPVWSSEQLLLVDLVYQLSQQRDPTTGAQDVSRNQVQFNLTRIVHFVKKILKDPPGVVDKKKCSSIEVSILQFLLAYLQQYPNPEALPSACHSLMGLWKEGLQLNTMPLVQFHLLA